MKQLPLGSQDFAELMDKNMLYVDKTEVIHKLVTTGKYYFFSRPRRFGKSLTLSTLREVFLGNKAIFKGLWIEDKIEWQAYPVIHISFSSLSTRRGEFQPHLQEKLLTIATKYGIDLKGSNIKSQVSNLVEALSTENQVVVLIDEYDKPIVDYLHDMPLANENRLIVKEFFEGLKDLDKHIRFLFITGVSKFSKVSLFSGLNNLTDITVNEDFAALCGYTQQELEHYFGEAFPAIAKKWGFTVEEVREELRKMYNGYNWLGERVYNPWAILNAVNAKDLANYWSGSGNPEFLLKKLHANLKYDLERVLVTRTLLESHSLENIDYRNLLFQTGYLTIESVDIRAQTFMLTYPNKEVKDALLQLMFSEFAYKLPGDGLPTALELAQALQEKDAEQAILIINSLFSGIPTQIFLAQYEAYYHSIIHVLFSLMGLHIRCEVSSAKGRADAVVHTADRIYVFEFKVDGTAEEAIAQIKNKGYAQPYLHAGKEVVLMGIALDKVKKGVSDWLEEAIEM